MSTPGDRGSTRPAAEHADVQILYHQSRPGGDYRKMRNVDIATTAGAKRTPGDRLRRHDVLLLEELHASPTSWNQPWNPRDPSAGCMWLIILSRNV
jgi:hypothetical protein